MFEFSFFWLISVFIFFTISATKLPSYWLPATPAASILISFSLTNHLKNDFLKSLAWKLTILLSIFFSIIFYSSKIWISTINGILDKESEDIEGGGEVGVIYSITTFTCRTSDCSSAGFGDSLATGGTTYTVREVRPDGNGMTVLTLEA